jgi:hypothetical protein
MLLLRREELILIDAWIAEHGVTLCPARFAHRSNALSAYELAARVAAFTPRQRQPTRAEAALRLRQLARMAEPSPRNDVDPAYHKWLLNLAVRFGR